MGKYHKRVEIGSKEKHERRISNLKTGQRHWRKKKSKQEKTGTRDTFFFFFCRYPIDSLFFLFPFSNFSRL